MTFPSSRLVLSIGATLFAAGTLGVALAQSPQRISDAPRPALPMAIADAQPRIHERAVRIDANRDGYVAPEELQAAREARRAEGMQRRMQRLDANRDGRVSTAEFEHAHMARLERADANRDGQVTRDEIRAMRQLIRAERMQRRGAPDGNPNG